MLALLDKGSDDRPWPDCFTTRREQLDRKSQNQSYVAWLESLCHGEIETDEDGEDEDHEEEDGDEAGGGDLSEGFIRDEDSHEAGDVDDDESFGGDTGNTSVASATEGLTGNGVIKDVMSGECGIFSYHSQTDLITSFCGTPKPILLEKQLLGDDPNRVVGSIFDITAGSRSRYAGVLKPSDFVDILNKKVCIGLICARRSLVVYFVLSSLTSFRGSWKMELQAQSLVRPFPSLKMTSRGGGCEYRLSCTALYGSLTWTATFRTPTPVAFLRCLPRRTGCRCHTFETLSTGSSALTPTWRLSNR